MDACVKQEVAVALSSSSRRDIVSDKRRLLPALPFIDLSDSGSSSESDDDEAPSKKRKLGIIIPKGFLHPLPPRLGRCGSSHRPGLLLSSTGRLGITRAVPVAVGIPTQLLQNFWITIG